MATKARKRIDMSKARIRFLVDENPRNKGTRAYKVVGAVMKNTKLPIAELEKRFGYTKRDRDWDLARKHAKIVKTA
jgi:hypothetical protein